MKTIVFRLAILAVLSMTTVVANADEVVVIVHPSNPLSEILVSDVKRFYLGKKKFFPGGDRVIPGDQPSGTQSRKFFYGGVIGKSETKLKSYWARLIFTGKGTPPKVIGTDHAIKQWVAGQPQAIGYVMRSEVDDTVKVLDLK